METTRVRFEKLFSIGLVHADFPTGFPSLAGATLADSLRFELDEPTARIFRQHEIICRLVHDSLVCDIRVEPGADRPFHRLPADFAARLLVYGSDELIARSGLAPGFGDTKVYHVQVKLKTNTSSATLTNGLLRQVASATPEREYRPGYGDQPATVVQHPVYISGCLLVVDVLTQGSGSHKLFKQEASQQLRYAVAGGKAHEHIYRITLKA